MKNLKSILFLILATVFIVPSCSKKGEMPSTIALLQQGKWKITLSREGEFDETQYFSGYEFTFSSNGIVTATKNGSSVIGSWSTAADDGDNLIFDFNTVILFQEMNEDWRVLEKSADKIRLEHASGGDSKIDVLTFERI